MRPETIPPRRQAGSILEMAYKILLVEDEPGLRLTLEDRLRNEVSPARRQRGNQIGSG